LVRKVNWLRLSSSKSMLAPTRYEADSVVAMIAAVWSAFAVRSAWYSPDSVDRYVSGYGDRSSDVLRTSLASDSRSLICSAVDSGSRVITY
jgi:hypothetical protein